MIALYIAAILFLMMLALVCCLIRIRHELMACRQAFEFVCGRRDGYRTEAHDAVAHAFRLERGMAAIRKAATFDFARRHWAISEDILIENDEAGDALKMMEGKLS